MRIWLEDFNLDNLTEYLPVDNICEYSKFNQNFKAAMKDSILILYPAQL